MNNTSTRYLQDKGDDISPMQGFASHNIGSEVTTLRGPSQLEQIQDEQSTIMPTLTKRVPMKD